MQPDLFQLPGYQFHEYQLVLVPHEDLSQKIQNVRKQFGEKYKASGNVGGRPQITLARFVQRQMVEEKLLNRLKNISMGYYPFKVELKDYAGFPTHSIVINVATKVEIRNLVRQLQGAQQLMKSPEASPHFLTDPHISLARKLLPWQYEQGWLEMSHRSFTGRFIADAMLLLKRRPGAKYFQILQRLEFMNLPVSTVQGALFQQNAFK